jgi:hypothetical protein
MGKYPPPTFLPNLKSDAYGKWLQRKAQTNVNRDRKRGNKTAKIGEYKKAIHQTLKKSNGKDYYTGKKLDWAKLNQWNNEEAKSDGRNYKKKFRNSPSVDHVGNGLGKPNFKICSWCVNDAKNDLTENEFIELCKQILEYRKRKKNT